MPFCILYLASPRSFHAYDDISQPSRLQLLQESLSISLELFPNTDIYVFHEDYTDEEFAVLTGVKEFIKVDFSGFETIYNPNLRRPRGYLMMCRFFSGIVQQYPQIQQYSHYMRLDDDSYFITPFLSETYVNNEILKKDYVYRSLFQDEKDQQSLYEFTLDFLRKEGLAKHLNTLTQVLKTKRFLRKNGTYTGMAPYNNFHVSSLRLWNNPMIQRYIQAIETSGGIFRLGWMDANIHAMIIFVLSLFCGMNVHHDGSFGYRHNKHISELGSEAVVYHEYLPFGK